MGFRVEALAVLVAAACADGGGDAPSPGGAGHLQGQGATVTSTDPFGVPFEWRAAPGYSLLGAVPAGDLDNDGWTDALVSASPNTEPESRELYFVHGPLRRTMSFPGDEAAHLHNVFGTGVGDATGDGILDFTIFSDDGATAVLPGPFEGELDTASAIPAPGIALLLNVDVDGDGIVDWITFHDNSTASFEVRYGPVSRFSGPPDLIVAPSCATSDAGYWFFDPPLVLPDITGDGVTDLWVRGYLDENCRGYLFSLPPSSATPYDPSKDPNALRVLDPGQVVPDQNGDGRADVVLADGTWGTLLGSLLEGPARPADEQMDPSGASLPIAPNNFTFLRPQSFDLNGDGIGEFLANTATDPDPSGTVVLLGGEANLLNPKAVVSWDGLRLQSYDAFVEDGVAAVLAYQNGVVGVLDIGPATSLK